MITAADLQDERDEREVGREPVPGGSFILDSPDAVTARWGRGTDVAWSAGEPLMIAGPQGVGKSTLAERLALGLGGIRSDEILGFPIDPLAGRLIYVAADRPRQIIRSLRRMVSERDRDQLDDRIRFWSGPLPFDLASEPKQLARFATQHGARDGALVIDSLKDVAVDLSKDETGSRVNVALQHVIAAGIEVCTLHHQRKPPQGSKVPQALADVYGSGWLTAGHGSVLMLWGEPGDPLVELHHLKQPVDDIGPLRIRHDSRTGTLELHQPSDLLAMIRTALNGGLTVTQAAIELFGVDIPTDVQREKARRKLDALVQRGFAVKTGGGPSTPTHYQSAGGQK